MTKEEWLKENGFNENEETYIYFPSDSYEIKEALKENGFKYNKTLKWHIAEIPLNFEDKVVKVTADKVSEDLEFIYNAKDYINNLLAEKRGVANSNWIGEKGLRVRNIKVKAIKMNSFYSMYGKITVITFETKEGNILKWFTSTFIDEDILNKENILITFTVKEHIIDNYENNAKVTLITRAVMKY